MTPETLLPSAPAPLRSATTESFRASESALAPRSWLGTILGIGLFARLAAFAWNDRLFGDVNLYALVARQWRETGRLDYPGKFDFFDPTPYLTLSSPASQHPPAWSWLAGLLASLPVGLDDFAALKILSLLCGLMVIVLGMQLARTLSPGQPHAPTAVGLVLALHPMLVDFSANGSPYIAVAAGALAVALAVCANDRPDWQRALLAGAGAALAWQVHGAGMLLVPAGLLGLTLNPRLVAAPRSSRRPGERNALPYSAPQPPRFGSGKRLRLLTVYLLTTTLLLAPLLLWNHAHFGTLLHSTSTYYLQGKLGLVALVEDAHGIHYQVGALGWQHVVPFLSLALISSGQFILHLGLESGVLGLGLAAFAGVTLWRNRALSRLALIGALAVVLAIAVPCLGWPEFKYRFLVPLLPFVLILATLGSAQLLAGTTHPRAATTRVILGLTGLFCLGFWFTQIALTGSPAKYYAYDREHLADYRLMQGAAAYLHAQPPGTVIAFSDTLDGGAESAWWHHHPTVSVRGVAPAHLKRLIDDFHPTYLLLSPSRRADVPPGATLGYENSAYLVYQLGAKRSELPAP